MDRMKLGPLEISWTRSFGVRELAPALASRKLASTDGMPRQDIATQSGGKPPHSIGLPGTPIFQGFLKDPGEYHA